MSKIADNIRLGLILLYFAVVTISTHIVQWLGLVLYPLNRQWFYSWQTMLKGHYAMVLLTMHSWCSPNTAKISGDHSVRGQISQSPDGKVHLAFPERLVLIANHQIYTDWTYLWWSAYSANHHSSLIIILKDAFRALPIFGHGMLFFSWVFLSRRWQIDETQIQNGMAHISRTRKNSPAWLLIFPEGTNLSPGTRETSKRFAEKMGMESMKHCLLPRTRGLQFCLAELDRTVEWVYDCTLAYGGIPPGEYGQDVYSLKALYLQGKKSPKAHIHWRCFATKNIPYKDTEAFDRWLFERWAEKDALLEHFEQTGDFPSENGFVEASVGPRNPFESLQTLTSAGIVYGLGWAIKSAYRSVIRPRRSI